MAITASFLPGARVLSVFGDNKSNSIKASRDAAGKILINGGAVAVVGGNPTVANTDLIQLFGQGGDDTITVDEINGPMPAAQIFGGDGNDTLTGGSANDLLFGQSGNDTLLGKGGNDQLFGGDGNDVLTGGAGDDQYSSHWQQRLDLLAIRIEGHAACDDAVPWGRRCCLRGGCADDFAGRHLCRVRRDRVGMDRAGN